MTALLKVVNVTKSYFRGQAVLCDLSLTLEEGELLGLLGESGSGKTTLLRLIAGFERPERGEIWIRNDWVAGDGHWLPPEQRRVGVVFQDYALFPHLTLQENVAFGLRSGSEAEKRQRVREAIGLVGLLEFQDRYPAELSGGQQQRVALARALAPSPQLVLLDEPFSNLDASIRYRLRLEVREILHRAQTAGIFVTHDQEEALSIADRVAVLNRGRLEQCDRPEVLYWSPQSRYVAEFVTQANFLAAERTAEGWKTEIGLLPADFKADSLDRGEIMVRQEDCTLVPDATSAVTVRGRQFLGREAIYCLQLPSGREMHIRRPDGDRLLAARTPVRLVLKPNKCLRCFPSGSEQR